MARYKSLPKTKKKKPDEFISTVDHIVRWISRHSKVILLVVVVLVAVGVGYLVIKQKQQRDLLTFNAELFNAQSKNSDQSKKDEALKALIKKYGRYDVSIAARLPFIRQQVEEGKIGDALNELSRASRSGSSLLSNLLKVSEIELLWQEGKLDEALEMIEKEVQGDPTARADYLDLIKAQILEQQGHKEEAMSLYVNLADESNEDEVVRIMANARMIWLKIQSE